MPEICRFFGIVIALYYRDHAPPHFHVKYGEYRGAISIREMELIEGHLPKRVTSLVLEWAFEHRPELMEDWLLSEERKPLKPIEPLV